jgi:hypothetical protein
MNQIDKAEYVQAVNAFLIPSSLFIACLCGAAGTFCLYSGEQLGWIFIVAMVSIIAWAFYAFINFQNKLRQQGGFRGKAVPNDSNVESSAGRF